jgi:hypothetical protein
MPTGPSCVHDVYPASSFANGRRHPVHGAGANVASLEHAGRAGLEGHWFAALQQRAYLTSADMVQKRGMLYQGVAASRLSGRVGRVTIIQVIDHQDAARRLCQ